MPMTVEARDQYEILKSDWPANDYSYDPDRERPFRAVPHANRETVLAADSPGELRDFVRADHAMRAGAVR